jgi:uncharacterized protein YbbC (DUF1343 family)
MNRFSSQLVLFLALTLAFAPARAKEWPPSKRGQVQLGVDRLLTRCLPRLQGKRVGLLTHKAGVTSTGRHTVDALLDRGVRLQALFAPEHGIFGEIEGGKEVAYTTYGKARIPVYSLYGKTRRPTPEMLAGLDVVLVDLQDVGARFYTYISTVDYLLAEAAKAGVAVWVLDRPNPIGGERVDGNSMDRSRVGFTAIYPMPLLHGMTIGEMALLLNAEYRHHANLEIVEMDGWTRDMLFGDTGLRWVAPSPNLPNWQSTLFYPGLESIAVNGFLAEGRGTPLPFQVVGAPWVDDPARFARALDSLRLPGVRFTPMRFTPVADRYKDKSCGGVRLEATSPARVDPMRLTLYLLRTLRALYPQAPGWTQVEKSLAHSLGTARGSERVLVRGGVDEVVRGWRPGIEEFQKVRRKYLLYPGRN